MQQLLEHIAQALNVKSPESETGISIMSKCENRSLSPLQHSDSQVAITVPDRLYSNANVPNDDEITRPNVKPVDKELVLAAFFGDQTNFPEDKMGGYDHHITSITSVSLEIMPIPEETEKGYVLIWIPLHLP